MITKCGVCGKRVNEVGQLRRLESGKSLRTNPILMICKGCRWKEMVVDDY